MTKTPENLPDPKMPTIILDTDAESPNTDAEMNYLKNNNIDEDIRHKPRKKYVYETDMHNIYNFIMGQTHEQLQKKAALDTTFQAVKIG